MKAYILSTRDVSINLDQYDSLYLILKNDMFACHRAPRRQNITSWRCVVHISPKDLLLQLTNESYPFPGINCFVNCTKYKSLPYSMLSILFFPERSNFVYYRFETKFFDRKFTKKFVSYYITHPKSRFNHKEIDRLFINITLFNTFKNNFYFF